MSFRVKEKEMENEKNTVNNENPETVPAEEGKKKKGYNKKLKELFTTALYFIGVLLVTWLLITFVIQRTVVEQTSMETTLQPGDSLLVDKISYRFTDPDRFEIVIFPYKLAEEKTFYIKRVIGLPGETVKIDYDGNIYINDELLVEDYGREVIQPNSAWSAKMNEGVKLGDDEYFVMGDNRNNSVDSRFDNVGPIKRDDIIGRAILRIWPLNKFGKIKKAGAE